MSAEDEAAEWTEAWRSGGQPEGSPPPRMSALTQDAIAAVLSVTALMTIGGFDWIESIREAAASAGQGTGAGYAEAAAVVGLYVARHAAMYVARVTWVLDYSASSLFVDD